MDQFAESEMSHFLLIPQIVVDELESLYYEPVYYHRASHTFFKNTRFFSSKERLRQDILYLLPPGIIPDKDLLLQMTGVVVIGPIHKKLAEAKLSVIQMHADTDVFSLFNDLSNIFLKYHEWDLAIQKAEENGDIVELAEQGKRIFQNPLFITDDRYNYIINQSWSGDLTKTTVNLRTGLTVIAPDQIQDMLNSKAYMKTLDTRHAHLYEDFPRVLNRIIYVNLWDSDGRFTGRVCINEIASPFSPGQFYTADYYADKVLHTLKNSRMTLDNNYNIVKSYLTAILSGEISEEKKIAEAMECIEMHPNDQYWAAWVAISDPKYQDVNATGICYEIEEKFPNSCAFPYKEGVGVVINQTLMTFEKEKIKELFLKATGSYPVRIGISDLFTDIYKLPDYMRQAFHALMVSDQIKNVQRSEPVYFFSDYSLYNILLYGCGDLPKSCILSPALSILYDYDLKNNTDYLHSLQVYLECGGNVAEAADNLFIHRSTMNYRVSRIEKLTGLDLSEYYTRLFLSLSYLIKMEILPEKE